MALAKEIEKLGISLETTEPSEIPSWTALIDVADGKGKIPLLHQSFWTDLSYSRRRCCGNLIRESM